jgi:uncharacterized damage-inducible protein DinB
MMQAHFVKLFHYEYWANKRVLDQLLSVPNVPEKAATLFAHVLFAHKIWLHRLGSLQEDIRQDYTKKELDRILDNNYVELIAFIKKQTDFTKTYTYTDLKGNTYTNSLHDIITHISIHGAYHRGQIVQFIKQVSEESIVTDYIAYARLEL